MGQSWDGRTGVGLGWEDWGTTGVGPWVDRTTRLKPSLGSHVEFRKARSASTYNQRRGLSSQMPVLTGLAWSGMPTNSASEAMKGLILDDHCG